MISPQSTKFPKKTLTQITTTANAQLQAMGVTIYIPLQEHDITLKPWLGDLFQLLDIGKEDCLFDSDLPFFDDKLKKLHLPKSTIVNEQDFKKLIWQNIRQFVN